MRFPPVGREFLRARAFFAIEERDEPDPIGPCDGVLAPFSFGGEAIHAFSVQETFERISFTRLCYLEWGIRAAEMFRGRMDDGTDVFVKSKSFESN